MHRLRAGVALFLLVVAVPQHALSATKEHTTPLSFGVFPRWNAHIMVRDFTPLARILSHALEREVRVETDKDFDSFMRRVYASEFDIVYLNQLQYVQAHAVAGYVAIAKLCESPACTIAAAIVVRSGSGVNQISDLRGKTVAFGDRNAMVSYYLASATLRMAGLDPNQYRIIFTKNPPNALFAVYNGAAEAAGVGSLVFSRPEIAQRVDLKRLRILAESQAIPQLPVAVRGDLDVQLTRRILAVLLDLPQRKDGAEWLKKLNAERFEVANDVEYAIVKSIVELADVDR